MGDHSTTNLVKADARNRALRTLWTALGIDLAVAIGLAASTWIADADVSSPAAWGALGILVTKSLVQAVASYLVRLKVAPATA